MDIILELLVAVILGALGISAPLNTRLKSLIGFGLLDLIKPGFKVPAPAPVVTPKFEDFMSGLGEFELVEEEVFYNYINVGHTPTAPKVELVQGKGKAAMVIIHTLSNDKLAFSVRWPSGNYYYLAKT